MVGIYKITNLINGKSYIGQSIHIERRWEEHCRPSTNSMIANAIKKYGKENFQFTILTECNIEDLNRLESYWINKENTITPYGYNVALDTESTHTTFYHFDKKVFEEIIADIKYSTLSLKAIAQKYRLNVSTISRINDGKIHIIENEIYPLRVIQHNNTNQQKICIDCGKPITYNATRCVHCQNLTKKQNLPMSREELKNLIKTIPFTTIGKLYNVSDNTIRKWCAKVNLPTKSKIIKAFTDEEWEKI